MKNVWTLASLAMSVMVGTALVVPAFAQPAQPVDAHVDKPRVIVTTDIGGDPDDQQSFVRFLLYSNQFDIEALVAVGSSPNPDQLRERIEAYGEVLPNLMVHADGWPEEQELLDLVYSGQPDRNLIETGEGMSTEGSEAIARAIERDDPRPLWITIWGGPNTLAQALIDLRAKHTPEDLARLISNVRVYSISDQDDSGPWIRREFPELFYIVNPTHGEGSDDIGRFDEYVYATWQGISGDRFFRHGGDGADFTTVSNEWLAENIGSKGPLGALYPPSTYIMEGDTPSYLGLINNGLNSYRRPDWGGWGGRYNYLTPYGEETPIWSSGGILNTTGINSQDEVVGAGGRTYVSDQATIWRWREQYQNDFAARINWSITEAYAEANHNPIAVVNGEANTDIIEIEAETDELIVLDARESSDPDDDNLTFNWFHYVEAGTSGAYPGVTEIDGADTARATVTVTAPCGPSPVESSEPSPCPGGVAHIILAVTDDSEPNLTSYRRVILTTESETSEAQ